jgi:hypothetical protein
VEALRKKERGVQNRMKLSLPPKKWCLIRPLLIANCTFFAHSLKISPSFGPNFRVLVLCFPDFTKKIKIKIKIKI